MRVLWSAAYSLTAKLANQHLGFERRLLMKTALRVAQVSRSPTRPNFGRSGKPRLIVKAPAFSIFRGRRWNHIDEDVPQTDRRSIGALKASFMNGERVVM